jgi:hypothetical protein
MGEGTDEFREARERSHFSSSQRITDPRVATVPSQARHPWSLFRDDLYIGSLRSIEGTFYVLYLKPKSPELSNGV